MSIAWKFMLAFLACGAVAIAIHTRHLASIELDRAERSMHAHHVVMGRSLGPALLEIWRTEGEDRAIALVETSSRSLGPMTIRWVWLDANESAMARLAAQPGALARARRGDEVVWVEHEHAGGRRVHTYVPLRAGTRPVALEFAETLSDEQAIVSRAISGDVLVTTLVALATSLVALALGTLLVARPMRALLDQAKRIGSGDLSRRLGLPGRDEFAVLSRAFDRMADELEESRNRERAETKEKIRALVSLRHAHRLTTVGNIASGLAHELGTPLNLIALRTKMLLGGEVSEADRTEYLERIAAHVERMTRIVQALLDFARPRELEKSIVDLHALASRVIAMVEPFAKNRQIGLTLAETRAPLEVFADPWQMEQVLTNLVVNALQACDAGCHVEVELARDTKVLPGDPAQTPRPSAIVVVRDDGPGIAEEDLPRLYELFFTTKEPGEGTGLGLPVTRGILEDHGGWLEVESTPRKGATFRVVLPLDV
jgi:signal transduction histidine kinase